MGNDELGVGMVGHAFMGAAHSQAWRTAPRVFDLPVRPIMRVLSGRDVDRATQAARKLGWAESTDDWRTLLERDDVDLVDVCTPGDTHAEIAIADHVHDHERPDRAQRSRRARRLHVVPAAVGVVALAPLQHRFLTVEEDQLEEGQTIECPECGAELEVVSTEPVELDIVSSDEPEEENFEDIDEEEEEKEE